MSINFFFDGLMAEGTNAASDANEVSQLLATRDGLSLAKNFMRIKNAELRRKIVALVEDLAPPAN